MANTQNLDLVKPLGTDHALVSVLNSNSDKIDAYAGAVNASLDGLRDGLGILADGNTHAAITSGQFVYVKNHQTLPQGLYQATTNIAANGTLSTSNLAADPKGGLNTLSEHIANIDIYNLGANSICSYADNVPANEIRNVWYEASNPDAPSNMQGYCKVISRESDVKLLIATSLEGNMYTRYRYGTWQSSWLSV